MVRSLATKRWTADEARRVLAAWRASRLSARAFAREHGLDAQRLSWWRKRLGLGPAPRARLDRSGARLVPAIVRPAADARDAVVAVRLPDGIVIEASSTDVSPQWVAALVRELAEP